MIKVSAETVRMYSGTGILSVLFENDSDEIRKVKTTNKVK